MAKICPVTNEKVLYLDCLDCDKECQKLSFEKQENKSDKEKKDESKSKKTI